MFLVFWLGFLVFDVFPGFDTVPGVSECSKVVPVFRVPGSHRRSHRRSHQGPNRASSFGGLGSLIRRKQRPLQFHRQRSWLRRIRLVEVRYQLRKQKRKKESLLIRKSEGLRGVSSGSIVRVKSEHYPKCKWCLLTSVSSTGEIQVNGYDIEFWNSKLSKSKRLTLEKIAQPTQCFRSKDGLVLIPLESRVFGNIRTFPTAYYNIEDSDEVKFNCFVMETEKNSLEGKSFTLMGRTKKDNQGKLQYDYELHADDGIVRKTYNDFGAHHFPRGGVILKGEGLQATCVGVLNFSSEGLISPVFFTQKTLTCKFVLFNSMLQSQ